MSRRTKQITESTPGFFVAMGEEIPLLKKEKNVNCGQAVGIYRDRKKLLSTIPADLKKAALEKTKIMEVIEVHVPNDAIVNPNHETFGIKPGKKVPIKKIQPLEEILSKVSATA